MNFKALIEKRNDIVDQMSQLFGAAEAEKRALSAEEVEKFDGLKAEIASIDATLKAAEEARGFEPMKETKKESSEEAEVRAFEKFLRGAKVEELRSGETQLVDGSSGVVLPKTIAKRILEAVKNISPILAKSDLYMVKGTLVFPKYDETSDSITVAYASEFTDLAEHSGVFTTVSLAQNLAGALVKISRSLINNSDFDVVSYAIAKVAEAIAKFFEGELLAGTGATGHMTGALVGGTSVTAAAATAISADDLINVQMAVAQKYRDNADACWIMTTSTLTAIRKLKDKEDRYLLTPDYAAGFGYTLLGHRVFESDAMDAIAASKKTVLFGDFKGLGVRITPEVQMQVLNEKFATQHATGIAAWVEADSKVLDAKAIAYLTMAASDPS
jgi:HK97 family phage major capsid protein